MKIKRIIAAVLSLCMVGGAFTFNSTAVRDYSITADAAGECYTFNSTSGQLTLKGNVVLEEIISFDEKEKVKSIKAAKGTILPENCKYLFGYFSQCISIDLSNADTSNVTNMSFMFNACYNLTSLNLSGFDTSNVTNMGWMFQGCNNLTSLDLSSFDTSNVTNMSGMFIECETLTALDLSCFNTSNVTYMDGMFGSCSSVTSLDLSNFDTSSVSSMSSMFGGCESLASLDLSSFDTSSVKKMEKIFDGCRNLLKLTLGNDFGDIVKDYCLPNGNGWVYASAPSTVISGSAEFAEFKNTGGTYVQYGIDKKGDVNCDGEITVADAVLLQKWLLGVPNTHLPYWQNADLCEDEVIDAFDLCLLKTTIINQK